MKLVPVSTRKVLSFDIENRPLSYWYQDVTTSEITAIAWSFYGERVESLLLPEVEPKEMLATFWEVYNSADLVTGHYIRRHDLPVLNAALIEYGLPLLPSKMTSDTKLDFAKRSGQPATLGHLGDVYGIDVPKYGMSQQMWRTANRLNDPAALEYTRKRVESDVLLQMNVRDAMIEAGHLKPPSMWHSIPGGLIIQEA